MNVWREAGVAREDGEEAGCQVRILPLCTSNKDPRTRRPNPADRSGRKYRRSKKVGPESPMAARKPGGTELD